MDVGERVGGIVGDCSIVGVGRNGAGRTQANPAASKRVIGRMIDLGCVAFIGP